MVKLIMFKRFIFVLAFFYLCIFPSQVLKAQDYQYSQFYASSLYLNPAFTGANVCSKVSITHRDQWPALPGKFISSNVTIDHSVPYLRSGFGLMLNKDLSGTAKLQTTNISFLYAHSVQINRSWHIRLGVQTGMAFRNIDYYNLVFPDQLVLGNGASSAVTRENIYKTNFLDFSTGALVNSEKYWFGFAAHHINQPNQSLLNSESALPIKYSVIAGAKFANKSIKSRKSISPSIYYKAQGKFDQLDIGFYYRKSPLVLGLWYRGLPLIKNYKSYINQDAVSVIIGLEIKTLRLGYSYDATISKLALSTRGSHELTISYQFCDYKRLKKHKKSVLSCPQF